MKCTSLFRETEGVVSPVSLFREAGCFGETRFAKHRNSYFVSRKTKKKKRGVKSIKASLFCYYFAKYSVFRCFAKQKGSFRLFRCFAKQAVSAKRVSRNTETVILFSRKTKQKEVWSQSKLPYFALISRNLLVFHCFAKCFAKRMRNKRKISRNSRSLRLFRCFAKQH